MNKMKISIVTPSYNQAEFLEETIRSILEQGYDDLEYVIVDGGSRDGSVDIIKQYSNRLHYWVSEPDEGHADALNKGFSHTSGEIMAWLNSDDMYLPWTFRVVSQIFSQFPEVNWLMGVPANWNRHGVLTSAAKVQKNIYDYLLGDFGWIQQESVFWRRSLWEAAGEEVSRGYNFMVDGELWSRFFLFEQLYHVECILAGYRFHDSNRAQQNYPEIETEMHQIIDSMKSCCKPEVLRNYRTLKIMRMLKPVSRPAKPFVKGTYAAARYQEILYRDGQWIKRPKNFPR